MKKKYLVCVAIALCTCPYISFGQLGWQQKGVTSDIETTPLTNDAYVNHNLNVLGTAKIGNIEILPANGVVTTFRLNSTDYVEMYSKASTSSAGASGPGLFMFNNTCPSFAASAGNVEFWTNGVPRLQVKRDGKIGMGNILINPLNGAVTTVQFNATDYVELYSKASTGNAGTSGPGLFMFNNTCPSFPTSAGNVEFWTNGLSRMKINRDGSVDAGNVSLNPDNAGIRSLRFNKTSTGNGYTEVYSQNDATMGSAILMGSRNENVAGHGGISFWAYNNTQFQSQQLDRAFEFLINNYTYGPIPPTLNQKVALAIHKDGKVLIGDVLNYGSLTNPALYPAGYKLIVQQGILTERLKVASSSDFLNWSDFVFDDDYALMPLPELESYIANNKHLPEIPSALEVKEEGIDVAAMDAKLLQKIEELTLYVIQQQKEINQLKQQVKK